MCADDELHPYHFLFIHRTGKLFHIALYHLLLERISQVASTVLNSHFSSYVPEIQEKKGFCEASHLFNQLIDKQKLMYYNPIN
jgi:hypothetical protein